MSNQDRQRWEALRTEGYKLLREAHSVYMGYALDKNLGEGKKDGTGRNQGAEPDSPGTGEAG